MKLIKFQKHGKDKRSKNADMKYESGDITKYSKNVKRVIQQY